jgi:hypothetical protein
MYWLAILLFILATGWYAYSVSSKVKVVGCSSCPKKNSFTDDK